MAEKSTLYYVGVFFAVIAVAFLIAFFFWFIVIGITILVCAVLIVIIAIFVIVAIALLFLIPYYLITKKPEVQHGGGYSLDDVKDKDDEKNKK